MSFEDRTGSPQPTQYELGFDPVNVPAGFPPFVGQDFAPAAGDLNAQPLVEMDNGQLPRRYRLPYGLGIDEVPAGDWTHVRTTEGVSLVGSEVAGVSFFTPELAELTIMVVHRSAPPAGIAELERTVKPPDPGQPEQMAERLRLAGVADQIHEAVRDISRFALSGSQAASPELPSITILGVDPQDPQLVSLRYRDQLNPDTVVVYRPTGSFERNGGRGRTFEEIVYTGVGELADGEDPAERYTALGTIEGETLIKFTSQAELWQRELDRAEATLFTAEGEHDRNNQAMLGLNNFALFLTDINGTRTERLGPAVAQDPETIKRLGGRTYADLFNDIDELMGSLDIPITKEDIDGYMGREPHTVVKPDLLDIYQGVWPVFKALVLEKGYNPLALKA